MHILIRLAVALVLLVGLAGRAAAATTIEQLVALSRAGLEDDILIALIETDGSRFVLKAEDILALYRQGLSNRVIRAMQATARKPRTPAPPRDALVAPTPAPEPAENAQAVPPEAVAPSAPAPRSEPPVVNVHPPDVNVTQDVTQHVHVEAPRPRIVETVHIPVPVYVQTPVVQKPDPPVYWGWGGQRRPDSWDDGAKDGDKARPRERD